MGKEHSKGKKYQLEEKTWILASDTSTFEDRLSSQGCDVKVYLVGDKITCGTFTIPPGKRLGRISAHPSDETYYVVSGTLQVELPRLEETITVKKGEVFYMPGGMIHAPYNAGKEDCVILWHCAPDWP
jgi:mannose-6-phosphate isomerase-like protein (cupin superfamily)